MRGVAIVLVAVAGAACAEEAPSASVLPGPDTDCAVGEAGESTELRCTGLYADWQHRTVDPAARPFDPGLHLWADGAAKTRWVYLPPGTQIDTSDMNEWTFPIGTKFWKEFAIGGRRMETRFLWKRADADWYRTTYLWSADESTATELTAGLADADGDGYEIPPQGQCAQCHQGRKDNVLGFDAIGLSSPGASGLTMAALVAANRLTAPPVAALAIPGTSDDAKVLGYLHANCGNICHNGGNGEANDTGFHMRLDVATLASLESTDLWTTGVAAPTYVAVPGAADPKILAPCDPSSSALYYRISHRDGVDGTPPGTQMPPIDSHKLDTAAVTMIATWIGNLPGCQTR